MKEVAYISVCFGILGFILMVYGTTLETNVAHYDCSDMNYVNDNYSGNNPQDKCYDDLASDYDNGRLFYSIGYGSMLFSLVLMIGANRLQD